MKKQGIGFISNIIIVLAVFILFFSGYKIEGILADYNASEKVYSEAEEFVSVQEVSEETEKAEETLDVDFTALQKVNPDVIGWIYLKDSNINYPIMKSEDNKDYLHVTYNGEKASAGSIFMDCRNSWGDHNVVIYGHNMKDGSMFHDLRNFRDKDWYESHQIISLVTPENGEVKYKVISVLNTDAYSSSYKMNFSSQDEYSEWVDEICKKSLYSVTPDYHKNVITLSTCRGVSGSDTRLVIHLQEL